MYSILLSSNLLADRSVNGVAENFSIRRNRLILSGDVSDHLGIYIQPDFAAAIPGSNTSVFFAQLRDLYGDVFHKVPGEVHNQAVLPGEPCIALVVNAGSLIPLTPEGEVLKLFSA